MKTTTTAIVLAAGLSIVGSAQADLIHNGSFEMSPFSQSWTTFDSIPGWNTMSTGKIELQRDVKGWDAMDGDYYVELDSHHAADAPYGIYQDIETVTGGEYALSLWFSPRPGVRHNTLQIMWNGALAGSYTADGRGLSNTAWQRIDLTLTAEGDSSRLELRLGDRRDTLGTFVDGVSMVAVPAPGAVALAAAGGLLATRRRR